MLEVAFFSASWSLPVTILGDTLCDEDCCSKHARLIIEGDDLLEEEIGEQISFGGFRLLIDQKRNHMLTSHMQLRKERVLG